MKRFYDEFIKLSLQQCTKEDYVDKSKVKKHNQALKKLSLLIAEINENERENVLSNLLSHCDSRVVINAASFSLQFGVLFEEARKALEKILASECDSTIIFSAEILLKRYY